jgi:hypothetical protein
MLPIRSSRWEPRPVMRPLSSSEWRLSPLGTGYSVRTESNLGSDELTETDRITLNEQALNSLQRQISGRVRIESQIEEGNRGVEIAFLTKAFAILVSFQVQLYFFEQVPAPCTALILWCLKVLPRCCSTPADLIKTINGTKYVCAPYGLPW